MQRKIMRKAVVPFALAAALTCVPFNRAGEGARLLGGKAHIEMTVEPAAKMKEAHAIANAGYFGGAQPMHEELGPAKCEERKQGAPWWLTALATMSSAANLFLFYGASFMKVWKTKNTESFSKASRLMAVAGSLLWVGYGLLIKDWMVAIMTGLALPGGIYVTFWKLKNKDAPKRLSPKEKKISGITTVAAAVAVGALAAAELLLGNVGAGIIVTAMGGVAVFLRNLSPWTQAAKTMLDKSTISFARLPFLTDPPSSAIWVAYGLAQGELLLAASNMLSLAVGTIMAAIVLKNWKKGGEATAGSAQSKP